MAHPVDRKPIRADSVARNTAFGLATQLTSAAITAALTLYLVRALDPKGYGIFALAVGIGTLLVLVSDAGITASAQRFIAEHRGQRSRTETVLADAFKLKLVAAALAAAALFVLADPIADAYDSEGLVWALRGIAVASFGQSMLLLYRGAFIALGRVSVTWRIVSLESAVEAAATVTLVLAGAGATGAAFGRAAGYVFGAVVGALAVIRLLGRRSLSAPFGSSGRLREITGYAGALFVVDSAFVLFERIDILLIGAIISTTAVAVFEAPLRLVTFLSYGGQAVAYGVAPRLARRSDEPPNAREFEAAIRYLVILQAALLAPILIWSGPIVDAALGAGYGESAKVLRALAPFMFLSAPGTFVTLAVNYLGEARRRIPIAVGAVIVNLILDAILIPKIGVLGGAIGTDVAFGLYVLAHLGVCRDLLGFSLERLLTTLARCLAAAGVMTAVLALFGTSSLSPLAAAAGTLAGVGSYVAVLVVSGELSRTELGSLRRGATRRLPLAR
jgi:O-antigen/teichoic acid export membrane protein